MSTMNLLVYYLSLNGWNSSGLPGHLSLHVVFPVRQVDHFAWQLRISTEKNWKLQIRLGLKVYTVSFLLNSIGLHQFTKGDSKGGENMFQILMWEQNGRCYWGHLQKHSLNQFNIFWFAIQKCHIFYRINILNYIKFYRHYF